MSKKDLNGKFDELMNLCRDGKEGVSSMAFSSEKSLSIGQNNAKFNLPTGFCYFNINGEINITGNVNNKSFSNHSTKNENIEDCVIVIADSRNENKITLFVKNPEIAKYNRKSTTSDQITIVIYWENGDYSYLAYILNNPLNNEIIVDANFVASKYQSDINRANCLRLLDKTTSNKITHLLTDENKKQKDEDDF